jgi:hypothetical protein
VLLVIFFDAAERCFDKPNVMLRFSITDSLHNVKGSTPSVSMSTTSHESKMYGTTYTRAVAISSLGAQLGKICAPEQRVRYSQDGKASDQLWVHSRVKRPVATSLMREGARKPMIYFSM